ncbi:DUF4365 domain-containing protein [uncultured Microbacterium sp.]|uniref:DUF4365 domain-containing protein n=1 Tax=uncultured Microbacterium sp. TaxID=191216 RepID=UPI0028D88259|nr:DUF4365 domain-containing protein [uncultured Microbacterium sp.]
MRGRPKRDTNHIKATWSTRAFESVLPDEWVVHSLAEDYGIDRRVEIFENGETTSLDFNVQLKSTSKGSGVKPSKSIRRETLGYWDDWSNPTLVVIAHKPTKTLWYRWSHMLDFDSNPNTASRLVRCEDELTPEAAAGLVDEVRAFRRARELSKYFPVDVSMTGTLFYGKDAGMLKTAISRKILTLRPYLRLVHGKPSLPYFFVQIEDDRLYAGLRGAGPGRLLTWGFNGGPRPYGAIASDVVAALAIDALGVGADDLGIKLLRLCMDDSEMLPSALAFGGVMAALTRRNEVGAVLSLMRRTYCIEGNPNGAAALMGFNSAADEASPELRRKVAHEVRDAARHWLQPAMGLYNAANMLDSADAEESIALYDEAAASDGAYLQRGYWWREKGTCYWNLGDADNAESSYREAVSLGDARAHPLLADVLMRSGRYAESISEFTRASIADEPGDAQWRLSAKALDHIVNELGLTMQERDSLLAPPFEPVDDQNPETEARQAIDSDALNGWAHAAVAAASTREGEPSLMSAITAAVSINTVPELWVGVLYSTVVDESLSEGERISVAADAARCAWKYFGDSFADTIYGWPDMPDEVRTSILQLFEDVRPPQPTFEVRRVSEGGIDSKHLPIGPVRPSN